MKITLYRTALCPRCKKFEQTLHQMMPEFPDLDLDIVEVATRPIESFRAGVRMIPALKCGEEMLSGVFLDEMRIRNFLEQHHAKSEQKHSGQ